MNGIVVLDTNVILYSLAGRISDPLIEIDSYYGVSVITKIELLSYPSIKPDEEKDIRDFLDSVEVIGINNDIEEIAINIRKQYRLKIADAIIAATAKHLEAKLITNDLKLVALTEIETQSVVII